jgi:hypothetical protein
MDKSDIDFDELVDIYEDDLIEEFIESDINDLIGGYSKVKQFTARPSEFVEFSIKIPVHGELVPFSFKGREYLKPIYNSKSSRVLLCSARQSEKSTMLGNIALSYCSLNFAFKVLYVNPTGQQAHTFSNDRIKEPIDLSPQLKQLAVANQRQSVQFKQFLNKSHIRIRYAYFTADRSRGLAEDMIMIDEIQDIITENIPVIEQCASHSDWRLFRYAGTPKSKDNTIYYYWSNFSTQNEWAVPCERHGLPNSPETWHWNILGARNIGKHGLICAKCGNTISAAHPNSQWVSMQPITEENKNRVIFDGYRIPQLMVPWVKWNEVLIEQETYPIAQFNNEVLGLSYDSGVKPITKDQIKACCNPKISMNRYMDYVGKCYGGVFAGLDFGTAENASFTVLTLGGYIDSVFQIFYARRFIGEFIEPARQLDEISKILTEVNFQLLGSDYGGGFDRNDFLMRNFGRHKVWKFQYAGQCKKKVFWQPQLGRFIVHRTEIMSDILNALKRRVIKLPRYEEFETPHADDIANIFSEYNRQLRMIQYKLTPGKSDDTFHSILYCILASMLIKPRPDIIIPNKEIDMKIH